MVHNDEGEESKKPSEKTSNYEIEKMTISFQVELILTVADKINLLLIAYDIFFLTYLILIANDMNLLAACSNYQLSMEGVQ